MKINKKLMSKLRNLDNVDLAKRLLFLQNRSSLDQREISYIVRVVKERSQQTKE